MLLSAKDGVACAVWLDDWVVGWYCWVGWFGWVGGWRSVAEWVEVGGWMGGWIKAL